MKKNPKLTDWFSASVKPTIKGIYEFKDFPAPYHYFNGKDWCGASTSPRGMNLKEWRASRTLSEMGCTYHIGAQWRGLAEDPNKGA